MKDTDIPFIGDVSQEETLTFLTRPDAQQLIDQHRIGFTGTLADATRISFVLDAASSAVPNDPYLKKLAAQFDVVVKDQTKALIKSLRAKPEQEKPEHESE